MATRVEKTDTEHSSGKSNSTIVERNRADDSITQDMKELASYQEGAAYDKARSVYAEQYQTLLTTTVPQAVEDFKAYIDQCMQKIIELDNQLAGG